LKICDAREAITRRDERKESRGTVPRRHPKQGRGVQVNIAAQTSGWHDEVRRVPIGKCPGTGKIIGRWDEHRHIEFIVATQTAVRLKTTDQVSEGWGVDAVHRIQRRRLTLRR
jgi:hypothetical protein